MSESRVGYLWTYLEQMWLFRGPGRGNKTKEQNALTSPKTSLPFTDADRKTEERIYVQRSFSDIYDGRRVGL